MCKVRKALLLQNTFVAFYPECCALYLHSCSHTLQGSLCMSLLCVCIQGSGADVQASAEAVAAAAAKVSCANKVRYCVLFQTANCTTETQSGSSDAASSQESRALIEHTSQTSATQKQLQDDDASVVATADAIAKAMAECSGQVSPSILWIEIPINSS